MSISTTEPFIDLNWQCTDSPEEGTIIWLELHVIRKPSDCHPALTGPFSVIGLMKLGQLCWSTGTREEGYSNRLTVAGRKGNLQ